ncbi:unnamed protein product [Didymodactylos carnosus]|nr:unnamed protein product [Didymodactylos carnosus]CAF4105873.1 unnamed protein product [Didymodactylos carnosus]
MDKFGTNLFPSTISTPVNRRRFSLAPTFNTPSTTPTQTPVNRRKSMVQTLSKSAIAEARREADEKRKAKYAKMERQREEVRQQIRDKYNIKKKEEPVAQIPPPCDGRITSEKKGPLFLPDDDDSFDPVKMASNALSTITEKLPFKLP